MTKLKNIVLSAAAVSLVTSSLFAAAGTPNIGTIKTTTGTAYTVASEIFDLNGTVSIPVNTVLYKPEGIPSGSLANPVFKFTASHAFTSAPAALKVYELNTSATGCSDSNLTGCTNNVLVANNPQLSSSNKVIGFTDATSGTIFVNNSKWYVLDDDTNSSNTLTTGNELNVTMSTATNVTVNAELYSGDSNDLVDSAPNTTIAQAQAEYTASISTQFNARIDTANGSLKFYDQYQATDKNDTMVLNIKDANVTYSVQSVLLDANITLVLNSDVNITSYVPFANRTVSNLSIQGTTGDTNTTAKQAAFDSNTTAGTNVTVAYTANGTAVINETNFGAHVFLSRVSNTLTKDLMSSSFTTGAAGYAGAWKYFGYTAQVPGANYNANASDTVITIVNTQTKGSAAVDAYFTIVDDLGNDCKLDSTMGKASVTKVTTGSKNKYRLSSMLADCTNMNPGNTAYAIEYNVPTTPSTIYSNAFVDNTAATNGKFKVLPVYNNSTSY